MPRKTKYSADEVVRAAVGLVRENGWSGLSVTGVAAIIGCSTMPIYSHFTNLEELQHAVLEKGWDILMEYEARTYIGDIWIDQAIGYVFFARDEKHLFRCMHDGQHLEKQRDLRMVNWDYLCGFLNDYEPFKGLDEDIVDQIRASRVMMTHGLATMVNIGWRPHAQADENIIKYITSGSKALLQGLAKDSGIPKK